MQHDKKVSAGVVRFVLVPRIGEAQYGVILPMDQVTRVVAEAGKASIWRE
jgi:hypothetical protein